MFGGGAALQFLAKAGMSLGPLFQRILDANEKDKYLDELEQHSKDVLIMNTKTENNEKK